MFPDALSQERGTHEAILDLSTTTSITSPASHSLSAELTPPPPPRLGRPRDPLAGPAGARASRRRLRSPLCLDGSASPPTTPLRRRPDGLPAAGTHRRAGDGTRAWWPWPWPQRSAARRPHTCVHARDPHRVPWDPNLGVLGGPAAGAGDTPLRRAWVLMPRRRPSPAPEALRSGRGPVRPPCALTCASVHPGQAAPGSLRRLRQSS